MKNFILLLGFMLFAGMAMGQMKIVSTGEAIVGDNTGISAPPAELHVVGQISMNSGGANNGLFGETNSRRMTVGTGLSTAGSSAFFEMFGNETQTGGLPGRAGEFNLAGNNIIIRAGKAPGNFGAIAAQIFADRSVTFNTATTRKLGNSNWTVISDKRLKNNVRSYDGGLDEVLNINPVWYTYNGEMGTDKSREFVGVLAQEFQKVAPYDVQEVSLTDEVTEKSASYLSINDSAIKYMLVNAIKEQQTMIEDLQGQIADLQDLIGSVDDNTSVDDVNLVDVSQSVLGQNTPNPYIEGTVISYSVAESASSAKMNFYSLTGQLIKSVSLQNGAGKVNVSADELPSGTYTYSLEVDGALISNKKMVKMR